MMVHKHAVLFQGMTRMLKSICSSLHVQFQYGHSTSSNGYSRKMGMKFCSRACSGKDSAHLTHGRANSFISIIHVDEHAAVRFECAIATTTEAINVERKMALFVLMRFVRMD